MFTNSGMFTARLDAVAFSTRMAGVAFPSASMWVMYSCVYSDGLFEEKASQWPFGENVCQEFMTGWFDASGRASPPLNGTM